jgi:hypothetical protein
VCWALLPPVLPGLRLAHRNLRFSAPMAISIQRARPARFMHAEKSLTLRIHLSRSRIQYSVAGIVWTVEAVFSCVRHNVQNFPTLWEASTPSTLPRSLTLSSAARQTHPTLACMLFWWAAILHLLKFVPAPINTGERDGELLILTGVGTGCTAHLTNNYHPSQC